MKRLVRGMEATSFELKLLFELASLAGLTIPIKIGYVCKGKITETLQMTVQKISY